MEMMRIPLFLKGIQKTNSIKGTGLNPVRLYSTQTLQTIAVYIGNLLEFHYYIQDIELNIKPYIQPIKIACPNYNHKFISFSQSIHLSREPFVAEIGDTLSSKHQQTRSQIPDHCTRPHLSMTHQVSDHITCILSFLELPLT